MSASPLAPPCASSSAPSSENAPDSAPSPCNVRANTAGRSRQERIVDFFNEVGMLRLTPRTGYQFLGSGQESVAEHSFRVSVMGYVLARMAGADVARTTFLCLFHDLAEARTGDMNYVNRIYNSANARRAMSDSVDGTGLEQDILPLWDELEDAQSLEALLAHDADQLDMIFNLKRESDLGNRFADTWLETALLRLRTPHAQELAAVMMTVNHSEWWYAGPHKDWWVNKKREEEEGKEKG